MDHHGTQFGVNCFRVWEVAAIDLPAFATRLVSAGNDVYNVTNAQITGGSGTAQVVAAWSRVASALESLFQESVDNTYAAADALSAIATAYSNSDADAKKEFDARRTDEITKHQNDPNVIVYDDPYYRPQIMGD
jgi:hypothetical protein